MTTDICGALHPKSDLACGRSREHRELPAPDNERHRCIVDGKAIEWTGQRVPASDEEQREGNLGDVIDRRVQVYGEVVETFVRIAQVWTGILGHEVQATDVPLMMIGLKAVRAHNMPDYSDNSDDIDGYLDIFKKIVGPDMIHARTVNEFIAQKWGA